ncbi:YciI family protein [Porticoccus sp. W117]|uniref:YciI family protein n=1 Tax=Porticoccus sp. W117 TaxID=3054777 RepID=UPI00259911B4|nr:YciI family protein [Porticoccus sp. W117]MDM3869897.1 YciI family protein [Porticoccus sp. W117]
MYYALLIYQEEGLFESLSEIERNDILQRHHQLQQQGKANGQFAAATKLAPANTARTVNKDGENVTVTDGPYAETKEVLAGFYVFDCGSLEEAENYARQIPHIKAGRVEVREVAFSDSGELRVHTE